MAASSDTEPSSTVGIFGELRILFRFCNPNMNAVTIPSIKTFDLAIADACREAGIRIETLNRIERLKMTPSVATVEKIDRALVKVEAQKR